jgi:ABC-2 type transport system permease protein
MIETVRLLLWLRYRTMFRGGSTGMRVFTVLASVMLLLPISLYLGYVSFSATERVAAEADGAALTLWVQFAFCGMYLMLVVMPVIGFAGNEFYDVTKLFHLPVGHRPVFVAQILGMMFGGTTIFFTPALLGVALGVGGGVSHLLLSIALLLLFLFNGVALGRMFQLILLNTLRSRRFRDLAAILAAVLFAGLFVTFRLTFQARDPLEDLVSLVERAVQTGSSAWLSAVPSSFVANLIAPGAGLSEVLLLVLIFLPLTVLCVLIAAVLQERAFFGDVPMASPKARGATDPARAGRRSIFSFLPETVRAVARREILLVRREPVVKAMLIQQGVFFLVPVAMALLGPRDGSGPDIGFILDWGVFLLLFVESVLVMNVFGLEGPGIVATLASPASRLQILYGKCLAYFLLFCPINLLFVVGAYTILRLVGVEVTISRALVAAIGAIAATLVLLAAGTVASVLAPMRLGTASRGALRQTKTGDGCITGLLRLLAMLVLAVLVTPIVLLSLLPILAPLSLLYGIALLAFSAFFGERLLRHREQEMILTLARSTD